MADSNENLVAALQAVGGSRLNTLTQPRFLDGPIGTADVGSLPLKDMGGTQQNMTNIIDIVNVTLPPGGLDREAVKKLLAEKKYADLPHKMGPKTEVPYGYSMQLVVLEGPAPLDGAGEKSATLVKHYFLTVPGAEKQKWRAAQVKKFMHGSPKLIDWGNGTSGGDRKDRRKAFEYILEQLGGFQCRWFEVAAANGDGGEAKLMTASEVQAGFDFIEQEAPRTSAKNAALRWITTQLNDRDSPIFGWKEGLVKEAVRNLQTEQNLAKVQTYYPITLADVAGWVLDIVEQVVPTLLSKSLLLVGEPGIGKTVLCHSFCMMMSRYHISRDGVDYQPSFRSAPQLDFSVAMQARSTVLTTSMTETWLWSFRRS